MQQRRTRRAAFLRQQSVLSLFVHRTTWCVFDAFWRGGGILASSWHFGGGGNRVVARLGTALYGTAGTR